jgi:hypothetical protein
MIRAKAGILLLNATIEHQKPLKRGAVAIALAEIDEPGRPLADCLYITTTLHSNPRPARRHVREMVN